MDRSEALSDRINFELFLKDFPCKNPLVGIQVYLDTFDEFKKSSSLISSDKIMFELKNLNSTIKELSDAGVPYVSFGTPISWLKNLVKNHHIGHEPAMIRKGLKSLF